MLQAAGVSMPGAPLMSSIAALGPRMQHGIMPIRACSLQHISSTAALQRTHLNAAPVHMQRGGMLRAHSSIIATPRQAGILPQHVSVPQHLSSSSSSRRKHKLVPRASAEVAEVAALALGYGCMVGSCFRSLPQVLKIVRSGTAVGLSLTGHVVELLTDVVKLAYNTSKGYHIAAFAENATCSVQGVVLVALIWWHSQLTKEHAAVAALIFGAFCIWLFSPMCAPGIMSTLQASTIAVGILGRVPQVILNIRRGNAGVLSASSCAMNLAGNLARVYTTVVLTGDSLVLGGAVVMALLNATLLQQALGTQAGRGQRVAVLA